MRHDLGIADGLPDWRGDVLVAFAMTGANARRVLELAKQFPHVRISALVEAREQLRPGEAQNRHFCRCESRDESYWYEQIEFQ